VAAQIKGIAVVVFVNPLFSWAFIKNVMEKNWRSCGFLL
jgi:hypothetical protein